MSGAAEETVSVTVTSRSALDKRIPAKLVVRHLAYSARLSNAFKWFGACFHRSTAGVYPDCSFHLAAAGDSDWHIHVLPTNGTQRNGRFRAFALPRLQ